MAIFFDGKARASETEKSLQRRVRKLVKGGVTPKLVSIVVGDEGGAKKYQEMKRFAANRIGAELSIISYQISIKPEKIISKIRELNEDNHVHGIMIQLPLPNKFINHRQLIINNIENEKDVDGMREDSLFTAPVVMAVLEALCASELTIKNSEFGKRKIVVVGAKGFVGKRIIEELGIRIKGSVGGYKEMGSEHPVFSTQNSELNKNQKLKTNNYEVVGVDVETKDLNQKTKSADVLITATGSSGIIKAEMVKNGVAIIDVGAPLPEVEVEILEKASFITPVPGGIGPVTIACLIENLVVAAESSVGD
jgi:methylenetetrahydrofolate dehydrogenase (NADP+) / methenyltetrahydrofolate cyclohydrolase